MFSLIHVLWLFFLFLCISTGLHHLDSSAGRLPYLFGGPSGTDLEGQVRS